jgi:hypothetical protein
METMRSSAVKEGFSSVHRLHRSNPLVDFFVESLQKKSLEQQEGNEVGVVNFKEGV